MNSVLLLVVDGLGAGWLGPYGNTWLETPASNRLAARARLFETAIVDSRSPYAVLESIFTGRHAACRESREFESPSASLPRLLHNIGAGSLLITDDPELAEAPLVESFDECVLFQERAAETLCDSFEQTRTAHLFELVAQRIFAADAPPLICVFAKGLYAPWDAPYHVRASLADPDDPPPPELTCPPLGECREADPDWLLGLRFAAAGQVFLFDWCLESLLDQIDHSPTGERLAVVLAGARGFPIGEHGVVGEPASGLFGELVHVPLMIGGAGGSAEPRRQPGIVQPASLAEWLARWYGLAPNEGHGACGGELPLEAAGGGWHASAHQVAATVSGRELRLQTNCWCARIQSLDAPQRLELYVKPDDRWEVNNVADLCEEVSAAFSQLGERCRGEGFHRALHENRGELPESLFVPAT